MAKKETKFNKLLNSEETNRSSDAHKVSTLVKREAKKEFARREKERLAKRKRLGLKSDIFVPPMTRNIPDATKEKVKKVEAVHEEEIKSKTSHVDHDEIKKAQEDLRKEQGYQEPEIDTSYKKSTIEEMPESVVNVDISIPEGISSSEIVLSGETEENDNKSEVETTDKSEPQKRALETETSTQEEEQEPENKTLAAIKKASKKHGEKFAAPEESLPDHITDQEIEDVMQQQEEEAKALEEEDEEDYSGMSEEEIAEAKERKRRLKELKARYNRKEAVQEGDEGDYRKSLDFTINTSIKRFRVKPPKKPIIITISAVFLFLIVAGIVTYFILNRPPAPIVMSSISLSQEETFQDVGEELDLRGLYIDCKYSDGSIQTLPVTESMISRKSDNIDADNMIASYDRNTYVYFTVNGFETMLEIKVTQIIIVENSLSIEIIGESFDEASMISFDNILILAKTTAGQTLRFDASEAIYKIGDTILPKISTDLQSGLQLPVEYTGDVTIAVSVIHNDNVYSTEITLSITALN